MTRKHKTNRNLERGQVIFLFAFGLVGLIAMVGLVTDTGMLLIEYGKLKRGIDAAAISAAQQYRLENAGDTDINSASLENAAKNFLQLNDSNVDVDSIIVTSCSSPDDDPDRPRPEKCNPNDPYDPAYSIDNRKYVQITASKTIKFGFMNILGIDSTTVTATSVGEAATVDIVLAVDTSESMAYGTTGDPYASNSGTPGDDPLSCNQANDCQPMKAVKDAALSFIETLYFPYDRVAIVTMTGQETGDDGVYATRNPQILLSLSSDKDEVTEKLEDLVVFQPRECDLDDGVIEEGVCRKYNGAAFDTMWCEPGQADSEDTSILFPEFRNCPSSNIGGMLRLAGDALTDSSLTRPDSFWAVVILAGGPANATDIPGVDIEGDPDDPYTKYGFCPYNTYLTDGGGVPSISKPICQDRLVSSRHEESDTIDWVYIDGTHYDLSIYDADDYARKKADDLATLTTGEGITIFSIGLGQDIKKTTYSNDTPPIPPAEDLLQYIAECAGEGVYDCSSVTDWKINHGQYFYSPTQGDLEEVFEKIANNIATRISQ